MTESNRRRVIFAIFFALLMTTLVLMAAKAHAGQIEQADHAPNGRLDVYYVEPVPTDRFPSRAYFETTDGATYRHVSYGSCARADLVPNRICKSVFWYAR